MAALLSIFLISNGHSGCLAILEKTISDLQTKIESIENEKLSLITAIKLVQDDNNSAIDIQHNYSTWQVPKSNVRSRSRTRRETFDHRRNKTFASTEINDEMQKTTTSNKFDVLSHSIENDGISNTAHESSNESDSPSILQQQTGNQSTKSRQTQTDEAKFKNKNPADYKTSAHKSSKLAFIAGDSIVQNVNGWQLSNSEQRVSVRSFSGSKTEDMKDYILL